MGDAAAQRNAPRHTVANRIPTSTRRLRRADGVYIYSGYHRPYVGPGFPPCACEALPSRPLARSRPRNPPGTGQLRA
jgi:hypothetical protein